MFSAPVFEANFDGLVGPTHHYAGLSFGNVASTRNAKLVSSPRNAALQGLSKAGKLRDLGLAQGILPPLRRPRLDTLRALGYAGTDASVLEKAFKAVPHLVSACYSASSMWVANAATFTPSCDSADGKPHFTPANLSSKFHRSLEVEQTSANLRRIFKEPAFVHHAPIMAQFGDEGAANHSRLTSAHGTAGLSLFAFGGSVIPGAAYAKPKKFPARQMIEASQAIRTTHGVFSDHALFLQQDPESIDVGVFHNDVVAVANENVLFLHERAYLDQRAQLAKIRQSWQTRFPAQELFVCEIPETEVPLTDAVTGYLFNSQLVSLPGGGMALVCPEECREVASIKQAIGRVIGEAKTPITQVLTYDVRESMQNGGGPACLRLRVVLTAAEAASVHAGVWLTPEREASLEAWIHRHYRDRLEADDLRDAKFFVEVQNAMDDLEKVLGLSLA